MKMTNRKNAYRSSQFACIQIELKFIIIVTLQNIISAVFFCEKFTLFCFICWCDLISKNHNKMRDKKSFDLD